MNESFLTINGCRLELVQGDITDQEVDGIVNAANSRLAIGGGVDGAIHRAGGPAIVQEVMRLYPDGCPTGAAVVTGAGNLPAKYVIHAVGPFWSGGRAGEALQLAKAYSSALELANENGCQSVALPALSTGTFGYPLDQAARVALKVAADFVARHGSPQCVRFVLRGQDAMGAFKAALDELADDSS